MSDIQKWKEKYALSTANELILRQENAGLRADLAKMADLVLTVSPYLESNSLYNLGKDWAELKLLALIHDTE